MVFGRFLMYKSIKCINAGRDTMGIRWQQMKCVSYHALNALLQGFIENTYAGCHDRYVTKALFGRY